jgi:hypothetical protein
MQRCVARSFVVRTAIRGEHSLSQGLGTLYQGVIADATNSSVGFSAHSGDSDTKYGQAHHGW